MSASLKNEVSRGQPELSICVPTYNRAACLEKLFGCLAQIKVAHGNDVEICISNNHSLDDTAAVIERWRARLELATVTQPTNIGATRNVAEVARLASGRWIMFLGDDDALNASSFAELLRVLRTAPDDEWILAGVGDGDGGETLLGDLREGRHTAEAFRWQVARRGLFPFGFIGMHVFSAALRPVLLGLSLEETQPWPHVALFLRHLARGAFRVFRRPVVHQAGAGRELFWRQGDWVKISLAKLNLIAGARRDEPGLEFYYDVLAARELYSARSLGDLARWRFFEPAEFRGDALGAHWARYRLLGASSVLAIPHGALLIALYATPTGSLRLAERLTGRGDSAARYVARRARLGQFDGVKRGL